MGRKRRERRRNQSPERKPPVRKIIYYRILREGFYSTLEESVKELTDIGWEPQGGLAIYPETSQAFHQAMILREPEPLPSGTTDPSAAWTPGATTRLP